MSFRLVLRQQFSRRRSAQCDRDSGGKGRELEQDMAQLVDDLQSAIPAALESDEHRRKIEQAEQQFQDEHGKSLDALAQEAHERGLEMIRTPSGIATGSDRDGQVISPEDFEKLSDEEKKAIEQAVETLQPKLQANHSKVSTDSASWPAKRSGS